MKAMPYLFAVSLAANLVLGWMLWQQHPAPASEPALVQSVYTDEEDLPLPTTPMPLTVSPLLPLAGAAAYDTGHFPPLDIQTNALSPTVEEKPYGPPPPPNPHAFPVWQERTPYRETQFQRALLSNPR